MAKAFNGFQRVSIFISFPLSAQIKLVANFYWLLLFTQLTLILHNNHQCNNNLVKALPIVVDELKAQHLIDHLITKQQSLQQLTESSKSESKNLNNPTSSSLLLLNNNQESSSKPPNSNITDVIQTYLKSNTTNDHELIVNLSLDSRRDPVEFLESTGSSRITNSGAGGKDIETIAAKLLTNHHYNHHQQQSDHLNDFPSKTTTKNIKEKIYCALEILIKVSIFVYCCLVIGYLCDEYFVPSLEDIGEALNLPSDLIGAILIPLGTSGPEIFSSAVGVFFAENDIGTGAIIGSGVFNILAIPAASGLAAAYFLGDSIKLEKGPVLRDLTFYFISIIVLILAIKDNTVDFVDSLLFTILFVVYIGVIMFYNVGGQTDSNPLEINDEKSKLVENNDDNYPNDQQLINNNNNNNKQQYAIGQNHPYYHHNQLPNNLTINNNLKKSDNGINNQKNGGKMKEYLNKCNEIMMINEKEPFLNKVAKLYDIEESRSYLNEYFIKQNLNDGTKELQDKFTVFIEGMLQQMENKSLKTIKMKCDYEKFDDLDDNGVGFTDNILLRVLLTPFMLIYSVTMPIRFPWITFMLSIMWLSILSYVTVWSISGLSDLIGIPSVVSGMTILAAGSAVPDLVTSIIVIKKTGTASMGICAAIASNIFAILLGLGLPWAFQFIYRWIKNANYHQSLIALQSSALPYTAMLLLATVAILYFVLRSSGWKISKQFSMICFMIHILFIASSIFLEISISNNTF